MNRKHAALVALAFVLAITTLANVAVAQTSSELKAKYPSIEAYAIRPDVWLIPKFADDGQPCELSLEKRQYSTFSEDEIEELTNELVPVSTRGPEKRFLGSRSFIVGGSSAIEHDFENLSITEYGVVNSGVSLVVIRWKQTACGEPASAKESWRRR